MTSPALLKSAQSPTFGQIVGLWRSIFGLLAARPAADGLSAFGLSEELHPSFSSSQRS